MRIVEVEVKKQVVSDINNPLRYLVVSETDTFLGKSAFPDTKEGRDDRQRNMQDLSSPIPIDLRDCLLKAESWKPKKRYLLCWNTGEDAWTSSLAGQSRNGVDFVLDFGEVSE